MTAPAEPTFDDAFAAAFTTLLRWRRDVRHFRPDPIAPDLLDRLLDAACLAPSVGYSQPWRFVLVESEAAREAVRANFEGANAEALGDYQGERAKLYASLKLAGLRDAPVQLAVFTDAGTQIGHGLGRKTMPETLAYSTVMAIQNFWLAARSANIGVGWVSILDPDALRADLHDQITDLGRGKLLEVDGGPSEFTLDRRVTPRSVQLAAAHSGLDASAAPTPAQVAARLKIRDRAHACLAPAGQDRCVLSFSKRAGAWRLAGLQAADLRAPVP